MLCLARITIGIYTGSFQTLPGETAQDADRRVKAYREQWSGVKQCIEVILYSRGSNSELLTYLFSNEDIMASHHDSLLSDLVRFVTDASQQLDRLSPAHATPGLRGQPPSRLEIPTAVVVAGQ